MQVNRSIFIWWDMRKIDINERVNIRRALISREKTICSYGVEKTSVLKCEEKVSLQDGIDKRNEEIAKNRKEVQNKGIIWISR